MAAAIASSTTSPPQLDNSSSAPDMSGRHPHQSSQSSQRTSLHRPSSYAKDRLSTYSSASQQRSRPASHTSPKFQSSLSYALVRDFAYPSNHPLHYGPPLRDSAASTPASETPRLSDPLSGSWNPSHSSWPAPNWNPEAMYSQQQLPAVAFGDGPPYSEDEDLHSPVVTTSRRRKHRSDHFGRGRSPGVQPRLGDAQEGGRGVFIGVNSDGSETYYTRDNEAGDNGPGGEYVTYPPNDASLPYLSPGSYGQGDPSLVPFDPGFEFDSDDEIPEDESWHNDPSRFSRDYQFTIVSPDEEMHGKAVALFDFTREHENELPLTEGQVILVSYRHGQGWLVAEDPKTGESGLVPEEFVRLVRDIEGGLNSLNGDLNTPMEVDDVPGPDVESTPTEIKRPNSSPPENTAPADTRNGNDSSDDTVNNENNLNDNNIPIAEASLSDRPDPRNEDDGTEQPKDKGRTKNPAVVSTFSTSSRDLSPFPQHLLGGHQHSRSTPPQIEHSGEHLSRSGSNSSSRPKSIAKPSTLSNSENDLES